MNFGHPAKSNFILPILTIVTLGYLQYVGWPATPSSADWQMIWRQAPPVFNRCATTTFSIEQFDERFGLTRQEFAAAIEEAAGVWEKSIGRELFGSADKGGIKINLIYDSRQATIDELKKIEGGLEQGQSVYSVLKERYDKQQAEYLASKTQLDQLKISYDAKMSTYQKEVNYWNDRGGAPKDQWQELNNEKRALDQLVATINTKVDALNKLVRTLNATAAELNRVAKELNLTVNQYNGVALENGTEFTEGDYQVNGFNRSINIYEFATRDQLVRVLAHEFGHALGLEHTDNVDDIMYRINQSTNDSPTINDVKQLRAKCGQ